MTSSARIPLYLFQVLEKEFISLHSPDLKSEVVTFPDPTQSGKTREITADLDCQFHPSHIKEPFGFIAELLLDSSFYTSGARISAISSMAPSDWTRVSLIRTLRKAFDTVSLNTFRRFNAIAAQQAVVKAGSPSPNTAPQPVEPGPPPENSLEQEVLKKLTVALNTLLTNPELYRPERFSSHWFSPATRQLVLSASDPVDFSGDDLIHFNRLLLEDAFPETFERIHDIRLAAMYKRLHAVKQNALCFSGGGIRSGTFALGLLQGLARHDLLKNFHYLSTVSGGGYIGSWLSAWIHRHPEGLHGVTKSLANTTPRSKVDPESAPVRHLRTFSNFITPQVGLLSADTWTFVGIYLRNLFLNWIVFIPLLIAALIIPRINLATILAQPSENVQVRWAFPIFNLNMNFVGRHIFLGLGLLLGAWALAYVTFNRPSVREELRRRRQFWRARSNQRSFLIYCLLPLVGAAFCLTTYWGWSTERSTAKSNLLMGGFGLALTLIAWIISSVVLGRFREGNQQDIDWYEFGALLVAGFVGGLLLGAGSLISAMGQPVIRLTPETIQSPHWLSWSDASQWTWLTWTTELYACLAVPVFLLTFLLAATFFVGVSSRSARVDDEDREWWARLGAWVFIAIIAWLVANALVIFGPIALLSAPKTLASIGGLSGLVAILIGRSAKTPANEEPAKNKKSTKAGLLSSLVGGSLPLLAMVFIAAFLASLSLATTGIFQGLALLNESWPATNLLWIYAFAVVRLSPLGVAASAVARGLPPSSLSIMIQIGGWFSPVSMLVPSFLKGLSWLEGRLPHNLNNWLTTVGFDTYLLHIYPKLKVSDVFTGAKIVHMNVLHHSSIWFVSGLGAILFVLGMLLSRVINLNLFSLHAGYRNRLIRAFLGASRPDHERKPNPFTGFDPLDNLAMHELRPALFAESDFLDPVKLVALLQDREIPLSKYLVTNHLLPRTNSQPKTNTVSPRLVNALRRDLNGVLQQQNLAAFSKRNLNANVPVDAGSARSTDYVLLNRSVLEDTYQNMFRSLPPLESYRLMPFINTTLNLVGGDNLAWQQRKAEPFSVTPLHSGCFRVGYRDSTEYGGIDTGGISIGTAAAISGAAASSNMGYYTTSPVLSLLLTFFNVRLGWWLGNPGPAGRYTFHRRAPKYSVGPVVDEALGFTDDTNKYVYLSDGGHFENLAIYEMVLRRCHIVVVSDGAQDQDYRFTDLGNAIRKIRIDLGIPIDFWNVPIRSGWPHEERGMYWAVGRIRYGCIDHGPEVKDGLLLYIKPAVYGTEPRDVLEYKKSFPDFPHQTTADQFFDEPQFESYRILGSHIMDQMCGSKDTTLAVYEMIEKAVNRVVESDDTDPRLEKWARAWIADEKKRIATATAGAGGSGAD
jgi:hypothetical protein